MTDCSYEFYTIHVDSLSSSTSNNFTTFLYRPLKSVVQVSVLNASFDARTSSSNVAYLHVDEFSSAFNDITGLADDTRQEISQSINDIILNVDTLVTAPADLMESVLDLFRLPATTEIDISLKLDSYSTIYSDIADGFVTTASQYGANVGKIGAAIMEALGISAAESPPP